MSQTILLTGAFGSIGSRVLRNLLADGHRLTCLDLKSPGAEAVSRAYADRVRIVWGDICERAVLEDALRGAGAVIHMAAIIPPLANDKPDLATAINVEATRTLVELMERSANAKRLVFASSMGLAGLEQHRREPPLRTDEPPAPNDHYGRTKASCETLIRASTLQWTLLRIAACPPERGGSEDEIKMIFDFSADGRVEFVHGDDVARAFSNAVRCDAAIGRLLFVGGGARCQTYAYDFFNSMLGATGLGPLPRAAFRPGPPYFFGDWLDTDESQALLRFQQHTLADLYASQRQAAGYKRHLLRLVAPLVNRRLLKHSPYWKQAGGA